MTDAKQFEKGDCVLYGVRAVCRISDVGSLAFGGDKKRPYYTLRPLFEPHGETIYAPLSGHVSIRPVMSATAARLCLGKLPQLPAVDADDPIGRQDALQSQDCLTLLAYVRALRLREAELARANRRLREADRRFLEHAEKLAYGELAAALEETPEAVRARAEAAFLA